MSNINTFAENMRRTVTAQTNTLNLLESIQKSITTKDAIVQYDYTKLDSTQEEKTYQIPSLIAIVNRLQAVETNLNNLSKGKGVITSTDGTRRKIQVASLPETPQQITGVTAPSTFSIDSNWFFEDMMFPTLYVTLNLTGQIDEYSDRVKISRIIIDKKNANAQQLWENNLQQNDYQYAALKSLLTYNNIPYAEDIQEIKLPLISNTVSGTFTITEDPEVINGYTWYKLDTISYSTINEDGIDVGQNNILSIGDRLSYADTLFNITDIDTTNQKIRITPISGSAIPGVYTMFKLYQDPFRKKEIKVKFGAGEYNIVYIKGVNEEYNLLGNEWSSPIKFDTDILVLDSDENKSLAQFYQESVMDWGSNMIAEAKERSIKAFYGQIPNVPVLSASALRVVQINTQINAALDTADIRNTASEIESTKTQIESLKQTIAAQKTELQSITVMDEYNAMMQAISTNTVELANLQTGYRTLVNTFKTAVKQNEAVLENPKYHIRGFFPIPEYKYRDEDKTIPETIIGFDIAYRYIREDNTGNDLNTFTYTDNDGTTLVQGTFTDWIVEQGYMRSRVFNTDTNMYEWKAENIADGSENNINQIDIPISKGEKVEIRVRSISEAGYPENPLKSGWSEPVIIAFPETLSTTNSIAELITEINDDALQIAISSSLDAIGVTAHLDDSVANSNSVNGLFYKHLAENIAYEYKDAAEGTVTSMSTQEVIDNILGRLSNLENLITKISQLVTAG